MKVAVVGNHCNIGYNILRYVNRVKPDVHQVLIYGRNNPPQLARDHDFDAFRDKMFCLGQAQVLAQRTLGGQMLRARHHVSILAAVERSDLIVSICCGLLGDIALRLFAKYTRKPIISLATGSDIRELPFAPGLYGHRKSRNARALFRKSKVVLLANIDQTSCAVRLKLPQWKFYPFPIDTDLYRPTNESLRRKRRDNGTLVLFHPSHLDWSYQGNERSSTKGNDRFLRAFARFVKKNPKAVVKMLSRGPDVEKTKQLVHELAIGAYIQFMPELDSETLIRNYHMADVVVDQFDIGSLGLIALEAMSCAKPVMIYINTQASDLIYADRPPVLNCRTEDEICEQLIKVSNEQYRQALGREAREWVIKYHHWEKATRQLILHYESVLGKK